MQLVAAAGEFKITHLRLALEAQNVDHSCEDQQQSTPQGDHEGVGQRPIDAAELKQQRLVIDSHALRIPGVGVARPLHHEPFERLSLLRGEKRAVAPALVERLLSRHQIADGGEQQRFVGTIIGRQSIDIGANLGREAVEFGARSAERLPSRAVKL